MKAVSALGLAATLSLANAAPRCPAPGEPIHWRADYCMQKMETDDEIAVSACIEEEGKLRFTSRCAANTYFKKKMCEQAIRSATRAGTLDACVKDQGFQGRTVRNGGVGG